MDDSDRTGRDRAGQAVGWDEVRRDYETGVMTCNAIARTYGLRRSQLEVHARRNKWARPGSLLIDRHILIQKLMGLLERQMDLMEDAMSRGETADSKALSDLVRDLDKLIVIEKAEALRSGHDNDTGEMRDLQRRIEQRINAITKGRA